MISGMHLLEKLRDDSGTSTQKYYHNGVKISRSSLSKGIKYYDLGITRFVGNVLVSLLQRNKIDSIEDLRTVFTIGDVLGRSRWLDLAGLIVPEAAVEKLFEKIESGEINKLGQVSDEFRQMHEKYSVYEIAWMTERIENWIGKKSDKFNAEDIIKFLEAWLKAVESLDQMRCADARKEFNATAMVGFGIDGDVEDRRRDFIEVRGEADSNDFITQLKARLTLKQQTVAVLKEKLSNL